MSVEVMMPTGKPTKFHLNESMTVQQLREKVVSETNRMPGYLCVRADDVRLTLSGETLENSSLVSKCVRASSVIHLVLRVHGG